MKTTQLFRKHNRVLALLYVTMTLIWLCVIFRENFMEDEFTMLCCDLPWNFLSFHQFVDKHAVQEEKRFIKSVCQSKGWSTKRICKEFAIKKWAVSSDEDQCKMQKTNSIEWKTGAKPLQTAKSE